MMETKKLPKGTKCDTWATGPTGPNGLKDERVIVTHKHKNKSIKKDGK